MGSAVKFSVFLAGFAAACGSPPPEGQAARILHGRAVRADDVAELRGVSVDRFEGDQLRFRARLERAEIDRRAGHAEAQGVSIEVLERGGAPRANVVAERGRTQVGGNRPHTVELEGDVRLRDREGRVVRAAALTYDVATERAEAPAPVTIEGDNFRATGGKLVAYTSTGTIDVEGPIRAQITPR